MTETNPREEKGKEISKKYDQIKRITEKYYRVQSQTTDFKWYDVVAVSSGWSCSCADHTYRHVCWITKIGKMSQMSVLPQ